MKSRDFLNENKIAKNAKVGDVVKVGVPGSREAGYLTTIKSTTETTATTQDGKTFDRKTGLLKGHDKRPQLGVTPVMHKASNKDIEQNYRDQLKSVIARIKFSDFTTEQLEKLLKALSDINNTNYQVHHFKHGWIGSKNNK